MRQGERLYSPLQLRSVMETAGIQFKKALGQNFLIDGNRVRQIVDAAGVVPGDIALEIGPGVGTLTEELLLRGIQVIAVEIDRTLIPVLHELFAAEEREGRFRLIEGDAMKLPLEEILKKEIGIVFKKVLEHAGVYKCTEEGRTAFMRFIDSL